VRSRRARARGGGRRRRAAGSACGAATASIGRRPASSHAGAAVQAAGTAGLDSDDVRESLGTRTVLEDDSELGVGLQVHLGPGVAGALLRGELLNGGGGGLTARYEGQKVRSSAVGPGELDGFTLNDAGRCVDSQSQDSGDERNKSSSGSEELHDYQRADWLS